MNGHLAQSKSTLPEPSWDGVRAIYKKLSAQFHILTDPYGLQLDTQTKMYLDHLILAIDDLDSCIDDQAAKEIRDSITDSLIAYLRSDAIHWEHTNVSDVLKQKIENLKFIVTDLGIEDSFIEAATTIFSMTEIKRHTDNTDELIAYVKEEGRATAMLPLSIMRISPASQFGIFFTRLCMLMGIADLIFDAYEDKRNGLIRVSPSFRLYMKLLTFLTVEGLKTIFSFPRKIRFLIYCLGFVKELARE